MKIVNITCTLILFTFTTTAQEKPKPFSEPGIYVGSSWNKDIKIEPVPQVWFSLYDFYVEGRYNYEDEKTYSVHLGRPFNIYEIKTDVTPTVGLVFGNFKGYSLGLNTETEEGTLINISSENQYCFSSVNTNFFFSWLKMSTSIIKNCNLGASWQYTLEPSSSVFDVGPMVAIKKGRFELEFFAYNPWKENRYWQFGVSLDLSGKK